MDMTVASLFKHKVRFTFEGVYTEIYEPMCYRRTHHYKSPTIENVKSLGLNDVKDLCTVHCKPLALYALSKIGHEDHVIPINDVTVSIGVYDAQEHEYYDITRYCFESMAISPELFFVNAQIDSISFPELLLNVRTHVFVHVYCYYFCNSLREEARFRREFNYNMYWNHTLSVEEYLEATNSDNEMSDGWQEVESDEEEPYTPPTETYREDRCVICLESKPNILYLDCAHIAICDSCDRLKTTHRKNCDMCRAKISKRLKL